MKICIFELPNTEYQDFQCCKTQKSKEKERKKKRKKEQGQGLFFASRTARKVSRRKDWKRISAESSLTSP